VDSICGLFLKYNFSVWDAGCRCARVIGLGVGVVLFPGALMFFPVDLCGGLLAARLRRTFKLHPASTVSYHPFQEFGRLQVFFIVCLSRYLWIGNFFSESLFFVLGFCVWVWFWFVWVLLCAEGNFRVHGELRTCD